MNLKLVSGILVLLSLAALIGFSNHTPDGVDPGCPYSDAYVQQCENAGGKICGENSIGNYECCHTINGVSTCENRKFGFWGHYKQWRACSNQMEVGSCPEL